MNIRPFKIAVSEEQLDDLLARLKLTRMPRSLDTESWDDGASLAFMERLISHWRLGFDWRAQEDRLNRFPQFIARVGELDVHFAHEKGKGPAPMPLVLTHGWPGSFAEMQEIIPLLSDPAAHGGDAADAFDERVFTLDQLLTDISIYWFSGNVASTLRIYKENRSEPLKFNDGERVEPALGMALFPAELPTPPRSWVERVFDVKRWTPMPKGGHFAAMEQPQLLAEEIRAFFRPLR